MSNQSPARKDGGDEPARPKDPFENRFTNPMFIRRREVIHESDMHADAVAICLLARKLKRLVDDFASDYTPDEAFHCFIQARCTISSDISEDEFDTNLFWSKWVYDDAMGFRWVLGMFLSTLSSNVCLPDENDDTDDDGTGGEEPPEDDDASMVVVCGERGAL